VKSIDKDIILDLLRQEELKNGNESVNIEVQIEQLKEKQDNLLDMRLEDKINEDIYLIKNNKLESEIKELEEEKKNIKNDAYEAKTLILLELAGSYYSSYYQ
jgi:hypothetical protein